MAAKFEISKDHAGKFRFHLRHPTATSSPPARDTRRRHAEKGIEAIKTHVPPPSTTVPPSLTREIPHVCCEKRCGTVGVVNADALSYALSRGADFAHPHPVVARRAGLGGRGGHRRVLVARSVLPIVSACDSVGPNRVSRELSTRESVRSRFVGLVQHGCGAGCRRRVWSPTRLGIACDGRGSSTPMLGSRGGSARTCCKRGREPWGPQADSGSVVTGVFVPNACGESHARRRVRDGLLQESGHVADVAAAARDVVFGGGGRPRG